MKNCLNKNIWFFKIVFILCFWALPVFAGNGGDKDKKINRIPINGHGVLVAGDYWTDICPINKEVWYRQYPTSFVNELSTGNISAKVASQNQTIFRLGNLDRSWTEPIAQWPSGFTQGNYWNNGFEVAAYDPSPTFNDASKASYWKVAGPNYAYMFYTNKLAGAGVPSRDFAEETKWVDVNKREQIIYRCGFPTNLGIDVQLTARQFTCNWNNLNDFVLYEFTFTNTGVLDVDGDGTPEKTNYTPVITFGTWREVVAASGAGDKTGVRFTDFSFGGRFSGYIGDNNPDGEPWDIFLTFCGANPNNVNPDGTMKSAGKNDLGIQFTSKAYIDRWMGMNWIAAKKGNGNPNNPDKTTIFGTHPIGVGAQKGWFHSAGQGQNLIVGSRFDNLNDGTTNIGGPKVSFIAFAGCFYEEGGKSRDKTKLIASPKPNPKFFQSSGDEDVTKWIPLPESQRQRPDGDFKLASEDPNLKSIAFPQKWEDGTMDDKGTQYPNGFGKWSKGYSHVNNFEAGAFTGIGPFKLEVGETMTIIFAEYGGFRLEGLQKSARAAEWTWKNGYSAPPAPGSSPTAYNLPVQTPPVPNMALEGTEKATVNVRWNNAAETDAQFAGYKIWRATNAPPKFTWTNSGMRVVDRYQEQMELGWTKDTYKKPMNPKFDAWADILAQSTKGEATCAEWGPYELVKIIPKSELAQYTDTKSYLGSTFQYKWEDTKVVYGFEYWFYVSAYKEGTYSGPGNETTNRIETSNVNRNGRSGLWMGTFSYADNNAFFPGNFSGPYPSNYSSNPEIAKKDIGARYIVRAKTVTAADINSGALTPKVTPNPYKRASSSDNLNSSVDHKIRFFNLPARGKLTILDVAGQIVDQIEFENTSGVSDVTWDMFSKDGIEVGNGLYIYIVEGGVGTSGADRKFTYVGKFAIMR